MAMKRVYRQRLKLVAVLMAILLPWLVIGEFGILQLYSLGWYWPVVTSSHLAGDCFNNEHPYCYNHQDGVYYFPASKNESSRRSTSGFSEPVKMLVFSDPHIMCTYEDELWIARWDADRYLKQSFSYLMSSLHPSPDVVVILGDVFSNGFRASDEQWREYLKCFHTIFSLPSSIKLIVVMGDNDIGGEGQDMMTGKVLRRYGDKFGPLNQVIYHKGRQFVKLTTVCYLNGHPSTDSEIKCRYDLHKFLHQISRTNHESMQPSVIFSHVPLDHLTPASQKDNVKSVILSSLVGTSFIFSGHIHHMKYSSHNVKDYASPSPLRIHRGLDHELSQADLANTGRTAYEITVPTCSYRMGERHMGVGAALLTEHGGLAYRVLWLPPRYPVLVSYVLLIVLLAFLLVGYLLSCKCFLPWCAR